MLYIFNQNEQLQAVLKPDTTPTYSRVTGEAYFIQPQNPTPDEAPPAPSTACPYFDAVHTEKLNGENTFTFSVPADHADSQYVVEGNLVAFKDLDANWQLFEIKRVTDIHGDGLTRTAYCEHAYYELIDDFIEDIRPYDVSAHFALTQALSGTRWQPGDVAELGLNNTNYYYESALSAVQKVASSWGGELQFRVMVEGGIISARYVDLLARRGADIGKQFVYSKDIKSIEREVDLTETKTALYGRGKGVEVGEGYGRRLDFADVVWAVAGGDPVDKPAGQEWVGDPDALARWGRPGGRHRFGTYDDPEETDPARLLQKTWEALQERKNPRITYRLDVADLEGLSGYSHEKVRLGDTVRVIDRAFSPALLVEARVIEIYRDLLRPEETRITLGNFAPDLADDALKQQQINQTVGDRQGVWDRATQFNQDGTLNTSWLTGIIDTLQNEVLAGNGSVTLTADNGILIVDDPEAPTKALRLLGGLLAISNEKDPGTGEWIWRTFGTGDGFTADELNAGQIRTSLIKIFGNSNFYWDGDYLYIVNPANLNEQIRLSKEGIRFTKDGGQTWLVAMDFSGLRMEGQSQDGHTNYTGDGVKVYDEAGNLVGHLGSFETLGPQTATFTRPSVAYKQDGTQVAANQPRFEYHALSYPVWQDTFDTDQLSQYTGGGDVAASWAVSGGVLTGTGGTDAYLLKNDLLLQDCDIVITTDQAARGAIKARFQDANNNYFLSLLDNTEGGGTGFINIAKRVNGVFSEIVGTNINFPRGTPATVKFSLHGSTLEAYFNGVKVLSCTDTTFTGGMVGLRQNAVTAGTSTRFLDFTVYHATQGVMVEEGTTNIVATWPTGWTVSGDAGMAAVDQGVLPGAALNTVRLTNSGTTAGYYSNFGSPFALNPSITYTLRIKARGTVAAGKFLVYVLSNTGTLVQASMTPTLTSAFQVFTVTFTTTADITGTNQYIRFDHNGNDAGYIEIAEVTLIQKAYALSFPGYGATRAAEVLTATSSVFTKGKWTVKLRYTPTSNQNTGTYKRIFEIEIDANNSYRILSDPSGILTLNVQSGGTYYYPISSQQLVVGNTYFIAASGDGSKIRLFCNGVQIGTDTSYIEPVGTLPANMYIGGASYGGDQANGIISDFAVMSRAQTLAEHQAEYNSGLPLSVDDVTTYLMSCDGHLQPTVRDFGLFTKNGRIVLQDPQVGQGMEVWDGATRKVLIGRLDDGTIGQEIRGGKIYSTEIRSGEPGASSYVQIDAGNSPIKLVDDNKVALELWTTRSYGFADGSGGTIVFYDTIANDADGYIMAWNDGTNRGLYIAAEEGGGSSNSREMVIAGSAIGIFVSDLDVSNPVGRSVDACIYGDLYATGILSAGDKQCIEETSQGKVGLYTRESPEVRYIDEGRATLVNGQCIIDLLEIDSRFLECIEPENEQTMWHVHLTPMGPFTPYVVEICGLDAYIAVASVEPGVNGKFTWSLSAIRKNKAGVRFPRMEWLVGGDEENDPVLEPDWEDELLSGVD